MRDFLRTLRPLLVGERVGYTRPTVRLRDLALGTRPPHVPIYPSALGPAMLRLADDAVRIVEYIRICVDDDKETARCAFGRAVLGYALAPPGAPKDRGYRAPFARMSFDAAPTNLKARRDQGDPEAELPPGTPAAGQLLRPDRWGGRRLRAASLGA